jgi:outer membrane protein assembly factor BamB
MLSKRNLILSLILSATSAIAAPDLYVDTFGGQFGTLDLTTGAFTQIGPFNSDPLLGLVPGPNGSLLGVSLGGNLDAINPATGVVSVIGATGMGPAPATSPFDTGEFQGTVYVTDGNNNLYAVNTTTGATTLIGATGLPPCPSVTDLTGLGDEAFFAAGGKFYLTFDGFDYTTNAVLVAPALYQINPTTGAATLIGPTAFGIDAALQVNGTVYAFTSADTVLSLDVANGSTSFVTNYDPNAMDITGATQTPEPALFGPLGIGIAAVLVAKRRGIHGWQR